jgi:uncharacterized protein (TIGR03435 family)
MPGPNDMDLMREYAASGSETAFAGLVQRHINLVYSVALRSTGNPQDAQDVAQAVFVILAKKATGLRQRTNLAGWLYETTRFTSRQLLRTRARRQTREQEAYMQSTLNDAGAANVWTQLAPHLEAAMETLAARDRALLVLRFYENKKAAEVAALLGIREDAAQKRLARAIEKLRKFFAKQGVAVSGAAITTAVSANSVQAAPAMLTQSVTALAVAKGGAAGGSTLTLIKGVLKLMAWTKAKTAVVATLIVLLAAGTTTVAVKEYQDHRTEAWEVPSADNPPANVGFNFPYPPEVRIKPSIYPGFKISMGESSVFIRRPDGSFIKTNSNPWTAIGLGVTLPDIVRTAYDADSMHTVFLASLPSNKLFDYVSDLPENSGRTLQELLKKQFGLIGRWEMVETNVLVLKYSYPDNPGLQAAESLMHSLNITNLTSYDRFNGCGREVAGRTVYIDQTMARLINQLGLENHCGLPIIDETGLTNRFDFFFKNPAWWDAYPEQTAYMDALSKQLGLELVPAIRPVRMLVVARMP